MSKSYVSIQKNMLWNTAGSLVYLGCQWLTTVLVVRLSSTYQAAGSLAVAMAVSNIFAPIALYKIRSYQASDVHHEISSGEYIAFRFVTTGLALVITVPYMVLTCAPSDYAVVLAYLAFRCGEVFIDVLHGVDQQSMRMDFCGKSMALRGVLFLIAFSVGLAISDNLFVAIVAMAIATYPVIVLDMHWARRFDSVRPEFNEKALMRLARECFPTVIGMVSSYAVTTIARQYLGIVQGNEVLGIYASVCTPVLIIQAGASYMYAPLIGPFAEAFAGGDKNRFRNLLNRVTVAIASISVAGTIGFFLFGSWFLSMVFGAEIAEYSYLLYAALVCTSLTAYIAFLSDLLIVMREMRGNVVGNLAAFFAVLPLMVLCISLWGMNGVSIAISGAYLVGILVMLRFVFQGLRGLSN